MWEVIGIVLEDNRGGFYTYIGPGGVFVNIVFEIGLEFGALLWVQSSCPKVLGCRFAA